MQRESDKSHPWSVLSGLLLDRYRAAWRAPQFRASLTLSIIFFAAATAANTLGGIYATERASNSVTDIILSNIPTLDVDLIFVYGSIAFIAIVIAILLIRPRSIPFTLSAMALFYVIRAIFVSLTHIGPYPDHVTLDVQSKIITLLWGGGDEFFSGHTGAPFMLALIFWQNKRLRYFFLAASVFFAAIVLLGHLHYSIDVASAFFITYTIYQMALWLFPREQKLFTAE